MRQTKNSHQRYPPPGDTLVLGFNNVIHSLNDAMRH
jgi:hypothetical protein